MTTQKQYFSISLEKGLKILALFNKGRTSISQTEISQLLGLNMTSTYRYINTFVELGYLEKDKQTKRLRPGIQTMLLCTNLLQAADNLQWIRKEVDRVHEAHNITIDVGLINNENTVRIYHREAAETLTYNLPEVAVNCLHNTSTGKAYLSTLSDDDLRATVERIPLIAKTKNTITSSNVLFEEIKRSKAKGYTMCREEFLPGLITIGAPLVGSNSGRCLGSVSFDFSILQNSYEEVEVSYASLVVKLAQKLSELLAD
ncbi:IclR family transcriptional regulator [bacterium]|nr:IclR family transcriptional regulator [bacterium]